MLRSMMQVYIKESNKAIAFYQHAFNAKILCNYTHDNGLVAHAELDIYGQVFALAETDQDSITTGDTMQFCLHFGEGKEAVVQHIYEALKEGAEIIHPINSCIYSPLMFDLIDKFKVRWCVFV